MCRVSPRSERQRVAAYGLACRGGEVLLVRTALRTWWLPGGGVEFGESPEECLVREFAEETGLDVRVHGLCAVLSDVADVAAERVRLHSVRLIYAVDVADGTSPEGMDGSTDAVSWVPAREVSALPLPSWLASWLPTAL